MNAIDTHALVKDLQAAGFDEPRAEAVVRAVRAGHEAMLSELATKIDLEALRAELKKDLEALRAELRKELAETKADILKWMFGAMGFQTIAVLGGAALLLQFIRG